MRQTTSAAAPAAPEGLILLDALFSLEKDARSGGEMFNKKTKSGKNFVQENRSSRVYKMSNN